MKIETLEEAAERLTYHDTLSWENTLAMESFKLGAKWQQEISYSEDEVLKLLLNIKRVNIYYEDVEKWLEQFKKK